VGANACLARIGQNASEGSNQTVHAQFDEPTIDLLSLGRRLACARIVDKAASVSFAGIA